MAFSKTTTTVVIKSLIDVIDYDSLYVLSPVQTCNLLPATSCMSGRAVKRDYFQRSAMSRESTFIADWVWIRGLIYKPS